MVFLRVFFNYESGFDILADCSFPCKYLHSPKEIEMANFNEDEIWDAIMESAKGKVDYERFTALFPFNPDNFLSSIIYGFSVGRSAEVITEKISAQVFMTGNTVDKGALSQFIEEHQSKLTEETTLTTKAFQMLDDGTEPELVYETISEALKG